MPIQTEKTAVGWLNLAISRTELLDAIIDSNDKTPIWDGDIFVYEKPGRKNEDLIRRVPVQVKGSITSDTNAQKVFHSIPVSNLKLYANEGGVLFIKVCFEKDGGNEAYYCGALLKGDIDNILSKTPGAVKRKTVYLNRYSFEKDSLEKLLTGFALALNRVSDAPGLCWSEVEEELGRGVLAADPLPDVIRPLDLYKYDSGAVRFVGREKEMEAIEKFLTSPRPFAWWGIAAPGGAGKSRLAYELKKKLDAEGIWKTELVKDNLIIELPAYSAERLNEEYPGPTLFIIDYAQQYAETIAKWMTRITADDFGRDWNSRIRFLLLDRANGEKETDAPAWEEQIIKNGANDRLYSQRYRPAMLLPPIEDELLVQIMRDFAVRLSENEETADEFTEEKARERVEALGRKEEGLLKRPLFAMMMTDLWLHNGGDADDWTMEDLLEGPIRREMRILNDRLSPYGGDGLKEACRGVLRMATVCSCKGDVSLDRLGELCPESMAEISNAERARNLIDGELMLRAGLCDNECEKALGMTPDLFGEYLLFHWLCNKDQERQHSKKVAGFYTAALEEMPSAVEFFKRLLKDFGQMMAEDDGLRMRVFPEEPGLDDRKTQLYARLLRLLFDEPNGKALLEVPKKTLVALADGRQGNTEENSVIWSDAGSACRDLGEHERALGFLLKSVKASEESRGGEDTETATTYNNIALVYYAIGDHDKALEYFLKTLAVFEKALGKDHPSTAATYNNIAMLYYAMGDYEKALEFNLKALKVREKVLGAEHPDTAATYNNIAALYQAMGEYDKALEFNLKTLAVFEQALGKDHPSTATAYNNIAQVYQDMGDYDNALEFNLKALKVREKVLGAEHPDTATTYNNIAGVYYDMGVYDNALEFNLKALKVREKVLGAEHPDTAAAYNNIALLYQAMGDFDKALEYFNRALGVVKKVLGEEHPHTAAAYNNIAQVYQAMGDYDKALEFNLKTLAVFEQALGKDHPSTATAYNNIAQVYQDMGDYDKALEFNIKALKVREKVLGAEHPDTAATYNNIAGVYQDTGDYAKALEFNMKALKVKENALSAEHPSTSATYNNIAGVYYFMGDYAKALEYFNKALGVVKKVLGEEHPHTAAAYNNIAQVYQAMGDYDRALEYFNKALGVVKKVLGEEHPHTAATYSNIAQVYLAMGNYDKALEYMKKDLTISEKVLGAEHPSTAKTYNNIGRLYLEQGRADEALEYLNKALNVFEAKLGPEHPYTVDTREAAEFAQLLSALPPEIREMIMQLNKLPEEQRAELLAAMSEEDSDTDE